MSIELTRTGTLFVIAAPSGGGKSTVLKAVLPRFDRMAYSISATSRPPRGSERTGVDYHFVSVEEFEAMIRRQELYEWAQVHGNYYGTPKALIEKTLAQGMDVIMDIDVQGARSVKALSPDAVTIFLLPPSMRVLEERLRGRATDKEDVIQVRLRNAAVEIAECRGFDYVLVNDNLERVVGEVESIIRAERHRGCRQKLLVQGEPAVEEKLDDRA